MTDNILMTTVDLVDDKVKFTGSAAEKNPITVDYYPPVGNGEGYTSLELLLISLSSCAGTSILSLYRKMGKNTEKFSIQANGIRRSQHPLSFEHIQLEIHIKATEDELPLLQKAIQMSEETFCPVWALLKNNVQIETKINFI